MKLWKILKTVLSAFIGVQSDKNRLDDFNSKSPIPFIVVGVAVAAALILALIILVNQLVG